MKRISITLALLLSFTAAAVAQDAQKVAQHLQDVSVTVKAGGSEGSGVIVTREIEGKKVNFVWTAGHVVASLRRVRDVVDQTGTSKKVVEFAPVQIVKRLVENGRKVGEINMDAKVLKYSNADTGQDLALLMVRKTGFVDVSASFWTDEEIPGIGTSVLHCGSMLGQLGSNSMSAGIVSQIGRVLDGNDDAVYDQSSATAFPGSSGGGLYSSDGKYIGMIVRGAGETFNLFVPVRRIREWASREKVEFAVDPKAKVPSLEELEKLPIDDSEK